MSDPQKGYQIGVGDPVNQQYLKHHEAHPTSSHPEASNLQQDSSYAAPPPPAYDPLAPDISIGGPAGAVGQAQQYQHFPPPHPTTAEQLSTNYQFPPPLIGSSTATEQPENFPPLPIDSAAQSSRQEYPPPATAQSLSYQHQLPPRGHTPEPTSNDPNSPLHYTRDPHRLTVYLIPFPKPHIKGTPPEGIPDRFLIYTPPPPPLPKPAEGEKEAKLQKVQRKWQEEVRAAKTSTAKTASWKGVKSKATRGISKAVNLTTSSNLDFLNRVPDGSDRRRSEDDGVHEEDTTHKTVGLQEMVLIYPSSYNATPEQVKTEFINSMMRSKSKAQRDAIIATGLLPVSAAIDILATVIWPFGGLLEVDGVWAYSSIRGAKTARSVTKRLTSSTKHGVTHHETEEQEMQGDKLHMNFRRDPRMEVLHRYLCTMCTKRDAKVFPSVGTATTESEVLEAIGWAPSQTGGEKNWEDEQWETSEVKEDLKNVMGKGAREWEKWVKAFEKSPEKALKR